MAAPPDPTHAPEGLTNPGEAVAASPFRLLMLPREVRDEIYKYVVVEAGSIDFNDPDEECCPSQPELLRVCHQIHTEASPLYYGYNQFIFHCGVPASHDMPSIPATINLMQHVAVTHECVLYYEVFALNFSQGLPSYQFDFEAYGYSLALPRKIARFDHVKSWVDISIANGNKVLTAELFKELLADIMNSKDEFRISDEERQVRKNMRDRFCSLGVISTCDTKVNSREV
jgi:hypothetical protein